jgi:hypothetical protein
MRCGQSQQDIGAPGIAHEQHLKRRCHGGEKAHSFHLAQSAQLPSECTIDLERQSRPLTGGHGWPRAIRGQFQQSRGVTKVLFPPGQIILPGLAFEMLLLPGGMVGGLQLQGRQGKWFVMTECGIGL